MPRATIGEAPIPVFASPAQVLEAAAPRLTREEELFALSLADLVQGTLGKDAAVLASGDAFLEPEAVAGLLLGVMASEDVGKSLGVDSPEVANIARQLRDQLAPAQGAEGESSAEEEAEGEGLEVGRCKLEPPLAIESAWFQQLNLMKRTLVST